MTQQTLDLAPSRADVVAENGGASRKNSPATSKDAARRTKAGSARSRILVVLAATEAGLNGYEARQACGIKANHIATQRLIELEALGFAHRTGTSRPTDSPGYRGEVFYATDRGRVEAERLRRTG